MNIGKAIRDARRRRNWPQGKLAQLAGMTQAYISFLEQGRRDPSWSTIKKTAEVLGLTVEQLICGQDTSRGRCQAKHAGAEIEGTTKCIVCAEREELIWALGVAQGRT